MEDSSSAVTYFEESVEFLSKLPSDDIEVSFCPGITFLIRMTVHADMF